MPEHTRASGVIRGCREFLHCFEVHARWRLAKLPYEATCLASKRDLGASNYHSSCDWDLKLALEKYSAP